jgi:hypothetical protein
MNGDPRNRPAPNPSAPACIGPHIRALQLASAQERGSPSELFGCELACPGVCPGV